MAKELKLSVEKLADLQVEYDALKAEFEAFKVAASTAVDERVKALEDAIAEAMPTMDITRRNLPNHSIAQRIDAHYRNFRTLLGSRGEEIDRKQRGM